MPMLMAYTEMMTDSELKADVEIMANVELKTDVEIMADARLMADTEIMADARLMADAEMMTNTDLKTDTEIMADTELKTDVGIMADARLIFAGPHKSFTKADDGLKTDISNAVLLAKKQIYEGMDEEYEDRRFSITTDNGLGFTLKMERRLYGIQTLLLLLMMRN